MTASTRCEDWMAVAEGFRSGEPAAVAKLSGLVVGFLHRQGAYRIQESWEDICQEVLAALLRTIQKGTLREPRAFVSYAYRITRNHYLDFILRRLRITSGGQRVEATLREPVEAIDLLEPDDPEPDLWLDVERALHTLPPRDRRVIEEIYLVGRTYQEVADLLSIPFGTVKRIQTAGLKSLRASLGVIPDPVTAVCPAGPEAWATSSRHDGWAALP